MMYLAWKYTQGLKVKDDRGSTKLEVIGKLKANCPVCQIVQNLDNGTEDEEV